MSAVFCSAVRPLGTRECQLLILLLVVPFSIEIEFVKRRLEVFLKQNVLFSGLPTFITVYILNIIPKIDVHETAKLQHWIFLSCPNYNLGWGIYSLSRNFNLKRTCRGSLTSFCPGGVTFIPCCDYYEAPGDTSVGTTGDTGDMSPVQF